MGENAQQCIEPELELTPDKPAFYEKAPVQPSCLHFDISSESGEVPCTHAQLDELELVRTLCYQTLGAADEEFALWHGQIYRASSCRIRATVHEPATALSKSEITNLYPGLIG